MKVAVGSDERTSLTDFVLRELRARGFEVETCGALAGEDMQWPEVGLRVAEEVAAGRCREGVLFCWTGTGVSIAANKVPGVRAALCADAETARGARIWNHANVLVMGLRLTSEAVAAEILEAWYTTGYGKGGDEENVGRVSEIEQKYR